MVFSRFSNAEKEEKGPPSPLPPFTLPLKEESSIVNLDLASTASTDTDSSLSIGLDDASPTAVDPVDLESPFGKLRHRTGEHATAHPQELVGFLAVNDSDSEHELLPRRRRKSNAAIKQYMFYAVVAFVGLSTLYSIPSTFVSRRDNAEWRYFQRHTIPLVKREFKKYQPEDQYTIVLRGGRLDLLQQSLDSFSRCPSVRQVQVDYQGGSEMPITLLSHESRKVVPKSETMPTSAVFLLSEGVLISCPEMEKGFQAWRKDPRRLIGYFGFSESTEDTTSLSNLEHVVPGTGSYAFVSDRAMFVHKLYLDSLLTRDERGACCDVSLSLQVSAGFEKAPVVVRANVVDLLEETTGNHRRHHHAGDCSNECLPSWLQVNDISSLPHEHTAILG